MPRDEREPQSYGSGGDWVTGRTGQEVNDQDSAPAPEHRDFYESSREADTGPHQGGRTSDVQRAESDAPAGSTSGESSPVAKVSSLPGGAKRDSYFKKRDYE